MSTNPDDLGVAHDDPIGYEPQDSSPPPLLLPYQARWAEDDSLLKISIKSRRIGITFATACQCVLVASLARGAGGMDCWYMANDEKDAKDFILDVVRWARVIGIPCEAQTMQVKFRSGFRVTSLSSSPRRLRGKQGFVIRDEAAHADDLSEFMKAAKAFVLRGGRLALISTDNGDASEFREIVRDVQAGKTEGSIHTTTIDDALAEGLYHQLCEYDFRIPYSKEGERAWRQQSVDFYGEDADEELFCKPRGGGGRYFSRRVLEECLQKSPSDAPVLRLRVDDEFTTKADIYRNSYVAAWLREHVDPVLAQIPEWAYLYLGEDFGRKSDLTVIAPMYLDRYMIRVIPFLLELRNVPIDQQRQIVFHVIDYFSKRGRLGGAFFDAGGNGGALAEFAAQRYGYSRIHQAHLAGGLPREPDKRRPDGDHTPSLRYSEALPGLKQHVEDRTIRLPRHEDVVRDLLMFERVDGVPMLPSTRTAGTDHGYRHGDAGVAIMLADYASIEFPVGPAVGPIAPPKDRAAGIAGRRRVW